MPAQVSSKEAAPALLVEAVRPEPARTATVVVAATFLTTEAM
jgi:hypothetical protein